MKTKVLWISILLISIVGIFSIRDIHYPFDGRTAYDHGFEFGTGHSIKEWNEKYKEHPELHVEDKCACLFFTPEN